ncbi:DUF2087 domain-containing protein [Desulfovibrio psychrotolerans]|uniref:DUF2087 domain-containing protein n=1 Tax=Desulfovibrio psychrotolerans TaxID=415242 RepID=A0A7J0BS58_9BACT|nr:DUF2087 domain-containing protein [Desulfovibrio psychrotolerans]GFM36537.1 hypothetical protein DSM19430T_12210 [Desulfovibrio psychrotolerans]
MSKERLPFSVGDISGFARSLRRQMDGRSQPPSHVEMLNLLARAGGYRNFQHFRAAGQAAAVPAGSTDGPAAEELKGALCAAAEQEAMHPEEVRRVERLGRYFDDKRALVRWPKKFSQQALCLWVLWSRLPSGVGISEREVNERLNDLHLFGDHALLRRELVDRGLVSRTADGRRYVRRESCPPAAALLLIRRLH